MTDKTNKEKKKKQRTPDYYHATEDERFKDSIYEPDGDTFLLMKCLDEQGRFLRSRFADDHEGVASAAAAAAVPATTTVLEVGPGSGVVLTHLCLHVLQHDALLALEEEEEQTTTATTKKNLVVPLRVAPFAVDVNPHALACTNLTFTKTRQSITKQVREKNVNEDVDELWDQRLPCSVDCVQADLFSSLRHKDDNNTSECQNTEPSSSFGFDIMLFNPPYVPTSDAEVARARAAHDYLTLACSGGVGGRLVLDQFLGSFWKFLSAPSCEAKKEGEETEVTKISSDGGGGGIAYVLVFEPNDPKEVMATAIARAGEGGIKLEAEIALTAHTGGERLHVLRFVRCS